VFRVPAGPGYQPDAEDAHEATEQFHEPGTLTEPDEGDGQGDRRHQVEGTGRDGEREPGDGVGPDDEAERRRQQAKVGGTDERGTAGVHDPVPAERGEGQREEHSGDHRVGRGLRPAVAAQQRLGCGVVGTLHEGGGQHDDAGRREPAGASGQADYGRARDGDGAAEHDSPGKPFVKEDAAKQDAEHRGDRDQQAGRACLDVHLAPVEQQLVGGHADRTAYRDQRQIPAAGQAHPGEQRDERESERGDGESQERERGHAQVRHADADCRKRRGPQHHGAG
jgi:hypothetical protein